jgi:hypothetical protein
MLPLHDGCWDVLSTEGLTKLVPQQLIASRTGGGVVGPPCLGITLQLLHDEVCLLMLSVAEEPKLELDGA